MQVILAASMMAVIAMAVTQFTKRIPYKPFNRELCMTWWLSLTWAVTHYLPTDCIIFIGWAVLTRQVLWKKWRTMF